MSLRLFYQAETEFSGLYLGQRGRNTLQNIQHLACLSMTEGAIIISISRGQDWFNQWGSL